MLFVVIKMFMVIQLLVMIMGVMIMTVVIIVVGSMWFRLIYGGNNNVISC